jgi:AraC-like DNA-binding protein
MSITSGELTFLHGTCQPRCIATVDKHFDYHVLQFMTAGGVELFYNQTRHEMNGAWMWSCQPGPQVRFHEWPPGSPWNHRYIAFSGPLTAKWQAQGLWLPGPEMVAAEDISELTIWFDQVLEHALRPGRLSRWRAINVLEAILLQRAQRRQTREARPPAWLARVTEELNRLDREPDYSRMARREGMSLTSLRRSFRAATGRSLHAFRLDCRIGEARRLLGETDLPLKQIAAALAYSDVFFFSRQFAQHVGVPPGAYRRSRQG